MLAIKSYDQLSFVSPLIGIVRLSAGRKQSRKAWIGYSKSIDNGGLQPASVASKLTINFQQCSEAFRRI